MVHSNSLHICILIKIFDNIERCELDLLTEEQQQLLKQKGSKIERLQSDINALSKPLLAAEGSTSWSKHVTPGTLSVFQEDSSWNKLVPKTQSGILKRKHSQELLETNGSSWKKMREVLNLDSSEGEADGDENVSETSSPTTKLNAHDMKTFGALPMEDDIVVVRSSCSRDKKKAGEDCADSSKLAIFFSDEEDISRGDEPSKGKMTEKENNFSNAAPAKRPPSLAEKPEKKKTKKEKQRQKATPKQKAPLDLDKQCGVIQGPNNVPCTRSLTCKSHSMGAKRAVAGRSQPYDVLLQAYQKKAIGRPQSATSSSVGAKGLKGNVRKLQSQTTSPTSTAGPVPQDDYIDSDEEVESVMQAIRQSCPAPLAEKPFYFVKRRRQCFRLRDILLDAITPKTMINNPGNVVSNPPPTNHYIDAHQQVPPGFTLQHHTMASRSSPSNNSMIGFSDGSHMFSPNVASPSSVNTTYSIR
ncbi:hypothetical protein EC973_005020 [Apophysomyces ossiformis]|uniref:SCA7 domain-containing protein n=1 Tax=Apophysomyces ossiformis TaxID=679940 RepID=A0A8H7BJW2_9FUNG|nr:hypothetical protein EC973_005020 [Apophysomyces ossiformis]